jgi:hypothetical protein
MIANEVTRAALGNGPAFRREIRSERTTARPLATLARLEG